MSSGVQRSRNQIFFGTGAQKDVLGVGFRPRHVRLMNENGITLEWFDHMADASAFKSVAAGDKTFVTTNAITPLNDGFRIGTDSINGAGEKIHYVCSE